MNREELNGLPFEVSRYYDRNAGDTDVYPETSTEQRQVGEVFDDDQKDILDQLLTQNRVHPIGLRAQISHSWGGRKNGLSYNDDASIRLSAQDEFDGEVPLINKRTHDPHTYESWFNPAGWIEESDRPTR